MANNYIGDQNSNRNSNPKQESPLSKVPGSALLQVTRNCNLKCTYCSQDSHTSTHFEGQGTDSLRFLDSVLVNLVALGIKNIRFTGGEPFTYPHLMPLTFRAKELGLSVSLVTNGTRVSDYDFLWLPRLSPKSIWITLHGHDPKSSKESTGSSICFSKSLSCISTLCLTGINVGVYYLLGDHNVATLHNTLTLLAENGVKRIKILQLVRQGRALNNKKCNSLSPGNLKFALQTIKEISQNTQSIFIKIAILSGQQKIFTHLGLSTKSSSPCNLGAEVPWAVDLLGNTYECCLLMNNRCNSIFNSIDGDSARKWLEQNLSSPKRKKINYCPALINLLGSSQHHRESHFFCPLTFIEVL